MHLHCPPAALFKRLSNCMMRVLYCAGSEREHRHGMLVIACGRASGVQQLPGAGLPARACGRRQPYAAR